MKKVLLTVVLLLFVNINLQAYSTEYSAKRYQEKYLKDKTIPQLQHAYEEYSHELDALIKKGGDACKNAGESFNTMEAERVGRHLYDTCESYRIGNIRKHIHKNKVIKKAIRFELDSRGVKP